MKAEPIPDLDRLPHAFPPRTSLATWIVYTDCVAHAVLSGQYAVEQTYLIDPRALVAPMKAPFKILEGIAGKPLV